MRCCSRSSACAQRWLRTQWTDADAATGGTQDERTRMSAGVESSARAQRQLLRATVRFNAVIFGALLGLITGLLLFVLATMAQPGAPTGLIVTLLGVFLPGYAPGWRSAVLGLFWGFVVGATLGGGIYWINYRNLLPKIDDLVAQVHTGGDLPVGGTPPTRPVARACHGNNRRTRAGCHHHLAGHSGHRGRERPRGASRGNPARLCRQRGGQRGRGD